MSAEMKCPHCSNGIHEAFTETPINPAQIVHSREGKILAGPLQWFFSFQRCPECHESIVILRRTYLGYHETIDGVHHGRAPDQPPISFMAFPTSQTRPIAPEVTGPYREDFAEACKVLPHSAKASAALSRRCLQAILKDKAGAKSKDLYDQIEEVASAGNLPTHIAEGLHAVRNIGNFAAHPMKSTTTGAIIDVEPGEAEWNLDVLDGLFDFYFIQPAVSAKRKADLNLKLKAAGKPEIP